MAHDHKVQSRWSSIGLTALIAIVTGLAGLWAGATLLVPGEAPLADKDFITATVVEGEVASTVRQQTPLGSLILTATLVMVVQLALVLLKRRDWGRRRALGANRFTIIALIVTHTGMLAVIGATIGVIMSLLVLQIWGDPLPSVSYLGATMVLAIAVSVFGAIFPAVIASYRDPITELRVP